MTENPFIDVPMSIFGNAFFSSKYERVGRWIHMWTHAAWKHEPKFVSFHEDDQDERTVDLAVYLRWLYREAGQLYLTGPNRDGMWLRRSKRPPRCQTYFIEAVGQEMVKIGKTTDLGQRIATLQTGSAHPLRLVRAIKGDRESEMHRQFAHLRVTGEWFLLNEQVRNRIAAVVD